MKASESASTFEERLKAAGLTLSGLTATTAVDQMLAFYREVRAANCMEDEDGDMLLHQWGTFDWDPGHGFQWNLTRQFIEPGTEDEDGISQLTLSLHFDASPELEALGADNHWCQSPEGVGSFELFVRTGAPYQAVAGLKPQDVTLDWVLV